jgi:hypothetical protein
MVQSFLPKVEPAPIAPSLRVTGTLCLPKPESVLREEGTMAGDGSLFPCVSSYQNSDQCSFLGRGLSCLSLYIAVTPEASTFKGTRSRCRLSLPSVSNYCTIIVSMLLRS